MCNSVSCTHVDPLNDDVSDLFGGLELDLNTSAEDRSVDFCAENDDAAFDNVTNDYPTAWIMELIELAAEDL